MRNPLDGAPMSHQIQLDLGHFSTATSLHEGLAAVLGFPGYYGKNWDAFDECIADQEVPWPMVSNWSCTTCRSLKNVFLVRPLSFATA